MFKQIKQCGTAKNQNKSCGKYELCMKIVFPDIPLLLTDILPNQKTNTADHNQKHNWYVDPRYIYLIDKRYIFFLISHQVKSGITER